MDDSEISSPRIISPEWHERSRCSSLDVAESDRIFFPEREDNKVVITMSRMRQTKAFCQGCPVFTECLEYALVKRERYGIWAGTTRKTRERIFRWLSEGTVTIREVVDDYLDGREARYERPDRRDLGVRAARVPA